MKVSSLAVWPDSEQHAYKANGEGKLGKYLINGEIGIGARHSRTYENVVLSAKVASPAMAREAIMPAHSSHIGEA